MSQQPKKLPRVTDHAVLRFLERVRGVDVQAVRREIQDVCASAVGTGAVCVKALGVKFELDHHGNVLTVTPDVGPWPSKTKTERVMGK